MGRHQLFKKKEVLFFFFLCQKCTKVKNRFEEEDTKKCLLFSKLFSQQALTKREFRVFENISKNFLSRFEGKAFEKEKEKKMSKKKKKRKKREKQGEKVPS